MAAISKRLLHLRPSSHSLTRPYPYTHRHFSSDNDDAPKPQTPSSVSSTLNDVRASLQNVPSPPSADRRQSPGSSFSFLSGAPSQTSPPSGPRSVEGFHQRLAEFRLRSASPSSPPPDGDKYVSLSKLYEQNFESKGESSGGPSGGGRRPFDFIRESLSNLEPAGAANSGRKPGDQISLSSFTANLKTDGKFVGGSWSNTAKGKGDTRLQFGETVDSSELGKKLQSLRPEKRKGKWFSFQELSNRLAKVRMAECEEREKREKELGLPPGLGIGSFKKLEKEADLKAKERAQRVTVGVWDFINEALNEKTGSPKDQLFRAGPPKDQLIENYFHPDNMSSAEKLKLELAKVRDEFKMSESDCGSARVQVAQLTTKIKHLSTALHKKDKHSRRGLKAMVERRKKLLKYIRRTDWDSYHLLLSKLGLRDNPDSKA